MKFHCETSFQMQVGTTDIATCVLLYMEYIALQGSNQETVN